MASNSMAYDLIFAMVEKIQKMEAGSAVPSEASASALQRLRRLGSSYSGGGSHKLRAADWLRKNTDMLRSRSLSVPQP